MNESQARARGYQFTGSYSKDKEEIKTRAAELRAAGNKAVVVDVPSSRRSRGRHLSGSMGYSVYWIESPANAAARERKERAALISRLEKERAQHLTEVATLEFRLNSLRQEEVTA